VLKVAEQFDTKYALLSLKKLGIKGVFLPGTSLDIIVNWVKDNVKPRC
jgi:hypothetical protein